ncbi:MAG: hemin uptake protein HemP [Thiotrichales bacterium]|nr:hemin uptake protein HemP [Thiotrichales bacterium]
MIYILIYTTDQRLDQEFSGEQHASSHELLCKQQYLSIEHNNKLYPLRLTRNDKLILTK